MSFFLYFIMVFISLYANDSVADLNINREFDADRCVNGQASRWANACICDDLNSYSGKYCSEPAGKNCTSNNDCSLNQFCLFHNGKGACFNNTVRNVLETSEAFYVLSDSLLSYLNVEVFCSSLDSGYRPISRKDLHCNFLGAGCLDREISLKLQDIFGMRGFFWLEEMQGTEKAYYVDLNDGTVYTTDQKNTMFNQALCIKDKK